MSDLEEVREQVAAAVEAHGAGNIRDDTIVAALRGDVELTRAAGRRGDEPTDNTQTA